MGEWGAWREREGEPPCSAREKSRLPHAGCDLLPCGPLFSSHLDVWNWQPGRFRIPDPSPQRRGCYIIGADATHPAVRHSLREGRNDLRRRRGCCYPGVPAAAGIGPGTRLSSARRAWGEEGESRSRSWAAAALEDLSVRLGSRCSRAPGAPFPSLRWVQKRIARGGRAGWYCGSSARGFFLVRLPRLRSSDLTFGVSALGLCFSQERRWWSLSRSGGC